MKYTEEQIKGFAEKIYRLNPAQSPFDAAIAGFKKAMELMQPPIKNHGDTICHECGAQNINWFAENDLFNSINGDGNGVFCPDCFIKKAEKVGINDIIFKAIRANDEPKPATKPLSEITDEDAIAVVKLFSRYTGVIEVVENISGGIILAKRFTSEKVLFRFKDAQYYEYKKGGYELTYSQRNVLVDDFLRSKGYILPTQNV